MTENSGTSSLSMLVIFIFVLACAATLVAAAVFLISDSPLQQKALTPPKNTGNDCGPVVCDEMCNKNHVYQVRTCTELCENDPDIFSRELGVSGVGTGDCAAWCEANMFDICRNACLQGSC